MNKPAQHFPKMSNYPKVLWYWLGGMIAVIIAVALYANFTAFQDQLRFELAEHMPGAFPQSVPTPQYAPSQVQVPAPAPQANIPVAFNPGAMEGTYNQIAAMMSKITVSIYSQAGPQTSPQLLGSGVIISNQFILTNLHIVRDRVNLTVSTGAPAGSSFSARLDRFDQYYDLALLSVANGGALTAYAQISDSDAVKAGDVVFAMGNAYGNGNFFTSGMIQDTGVFLDANQQAHNGLFMTNINIYPGFCGSPLVNMRGEIIGINNSANCLNNIGMGQAIPINQALSLLRGDVQNQNLPVPRMIPAPPIQLPTPGHGNPYSLA